MKAVDVAEKADPSGFILAREERTRLLVRTQRLSDLLRAEDLDVAWYIDAMREPEHIEYAKVFLQTVRKTLSGEIQRFPGSCTAPAPGLDRVDIILHRRNKRGHTGKCNHRLSRSLSGFVGRSCFSSAPPAKGRRAAP